MNISRRGRSYVQTGAEYLQGIALSNSPRSEWLWGRVSCHLMITRVKAASSRVFAWKPGGHEKVQVLARVFPFDQVFQKTISLGLSTPFYLCFCSLSWLFVSCQGLNPGLYLLT